MGNKNAQGYANNQGKENGGYYNRYRNDHHIPIAQPTDKKDHQGENQTGFPGKELAASRKDNNYPTPPRQPGKKGFQIINKKQGKIADS